MTVFLVVKVDLPAGQTVHVSEVWEVAALNFPLAQSTQSPPIPPLVRNLPAGHALHWAVPVAPVASVEMPPAPVQAVHVCCPAVA